jgi:LmbE family N-acetylglucosaminyl deacetylase
MSSGQASGTRVLAVCAHPDDESFGLGGIIATMVGWGASVHLLCLTRGERSTLGVGDGDLATIRTDELQAAGTALGLASVRILDHPDGALASVPSETLVAEVSESADSTDLLLVFDEGGITGHPDHCRATSAAVTLARRRGIPVLAWTVEERVANALRQELGLAFVGRAPEDIDLHLDVDRARQLEAMRCHRSQIEGNVVPLRRLDLTGDTEPLRYLHQLPPD